MTALEGLKVIDLSRVLAGPFCAQISGDHGAQVIKLKGPAGEDRLDDSRAGERDLQRLSQPRAGSERSVKGLTFFNATEQTLLRTLQHGEFNIQGLGQADLLARLGMTPSAMTRQLRRLRALGLIKKITHTYRYYLPRVGRAAIAAACSLTRFNIVPAMAAAH
jgi:DNA-binding MarR family transcriptional regulator